MFVVLQALKKVPGVNSSWHGDFIRQYRNIDISIAVQTPNGLMVPVVRDPQSKGLTEIGAAVKALAGKVDHLLPVFLSFVLLLVLKDLLAVSFHACCLCLVVCLDRHNTCSALGAASNCV